MSRTKKVVLVSGILTLVLMAAYVLTKETFVFIAGSSCAAATMVVPLDSFFGIAHESRRGWLLIPILLITVSCVCTHFAAGAAEEIKKWSQDVGVCFRFLCNWLSFLDPYRNKEKM